MVEYETAELTGRERARIVKSAVTPRPIAWVSTRSTDGVDNLAPFSSYNYVSADHPVVLFSSPNGANGGLKDTARNAVETGAFAVNVVSREHAEAADRTSERLPPEDSEFEAAGVTPTECETIDAPRVADAVVTMECTLYDTLEVYDRIVVLGDVRHFHVDESVIVDGTVDATEFETVGRLGGPYYTFAEIAEIQRRY